MILLVNPVGDFPLNDDWVYAFSVKSLLENSYFQIHSSSSANVGPQIYWGALFCIPQGFSFTALRLSSLTLGLFGGWATYGLLADVWRNRALALVGGLVLLVNPVYFGLANSFMTDIPFLALLITAMFLLVRGMRTEKTPIIVGGLLLCLVGVLLRQFALVVLLGFAAAQLAKGGFGWRNVLNSVLPLVIGLVVHFAFSRWLIESGRKPYSGGIGDITPHSVADFLRTAVHESFIALNYIGLFVLPLIGACISFSRIRVVRNGNRFAIVLVVSTAIVLVSILQLRHETMPLGQNVLTYFGMGPLTLRDTYLLGLNLPAMTPGLSIFWKVVTGASIVGASLVVLALFVGVRLPIITMRQGRVGRNAVWEPIFFVTIAISYFGLLVVLATRNALFERYLLPLFVLSLLVAPTLAGVRTGQARSSPMRRTVVTALLAAFASFSVLATHDYLEWNRMRWTALHDLTDEQKIDPHRIDGGYEFNGWLTYDPLYKPHDYKSYWWVDDDEYMLASGPISGYREVRRLAFRRWLTNTESYVAVLRRMP